MLAPPSSLTRTTDSRRITTGLLAGLAVPWALSAKASPRLLAARAADDGERLRLVFELNGRPQYRTFTLQSPDRLIIDLDNTHVANSLGHFPEASRLVTAVRSGAYPFDSRRDRVYFQRQ
ncbi:AMIN domain-containing protein [Pseudomonas sp. p106]|nr:AMIN domain-containing protein [Pseudomonas sp. p106]